MGRRGEAKRLNSFRRGVRNSVSAEQPTGSRPRTAPGCGEDGDGGMPVVRNAGELSLTIPQGWRGYIATTQADSDEADPKAFDSRAAAHRAARSGGVGSCTKLGADRRSNHELEFGGMFGGRKHGCRGNRHVRG